MSTIIHAAQNIYHPRDLFQRQDKWFPPGPLTHLQTGGGHTDDVKESAEDARGDTQEGVSGHYSGQGGSGLGEVPGCQVPNCQLHLRGGQQVPDSEGREPEQNGGWSQEGGGSGEGGWSEGTSGTSS